MPVLLGPAIEGLNLKTDGCYIDGTFGRGGHAGEILQRLGSEGRLLAIDRDPDAIAAAPEALRNDQRLTLINGTFSEINTYATERNLLGKVDGLLLDLGVSSPQLDEARRGFSFRAEGPLDMRMDPASGQSAADWLESVDEQTLKKVLQKFGEERFAGRIARAIVAARDESPIRTTTRRAFGLSTTPPSLQTSSARPRRRRSRNGTRLQRHFRAFGYSSIANSMNCRQHSKHQSNCFAREGAWRSSAFTRWKTVQ